MASASSVMSRSSLPGLVRRMTPSKRWPVGHQAPTVAWSSTGSDRFGAAGPPAKVPERGVGAPHREAVDVRVGARRQAADARAADDQALLACRKVVRLALGDGVRW